MKIEKEELISILTQFNPWWIDEPIPDLPRWNRAAFKELHGWVTQPPVSRAVMLSGARQVGKTTLLMQVIRHLLRDHVPAANILYATFDHPLLKLAGIDAVLEAWRSREPKKEGKEFIFLDEAQLIRDWGTWIKHQVDFQKGRQIVFTGSALPLTKENQESGVGRWHTIRLTTLSFFEYCQLRQLDLPKLPPLRALEELVDWLDPEIYKTRELLSHYIAHFHHYLIRGGFPQTAQLESITQAQKLLREDIIDKVLKRDMTALFGVRRILELEHTFLYLCLHDGCVLDMQKLCKNLEVNRGTAQNFIDLLESTHLIYRLQPFGYGAEVLRGKFKVYLSDAAIGPAVMLKGQSLLDDPAALGIAAESCVLKHLFTRYYRDNVQFSYWRYKEDQEVDFIAAINNKRIPFEVKYRSSFSAQDLTGLMKFCEDKKLDCGYVITKSPSDFGLLPRAIGQPPLFRIPAALFCYWMGELENGPYFISSDTNNKYWGLDW